MFPCVNTYDSVICTQSSEKDQTLLQTWFTTLSTLFCLLLLPKNPDQNQNANMANNKQEEFVLSLDVGTTNIRAFIYDQTGAIRGHDNDKVSSKNRCVKVTNCLYIIHCVVQVNLCQKLLFLHQLTHNMITDCSLNYQFST